MSQTPEEIQRDIEAQRAELAGTVDQLAAKMDVKSHAQRTAADVRDRATTADGRPRPELLAVAAGVVGLVALFVVLTKPPSGGLLSLM